MEEESVTVIRESTRNLVRLSRRNHRGEDTDLRRSIPDSCKSSGTVVNIANKLKTKCPVSVDELRTLKNALLEDAKNIDIVLSTHGALRGLVREISGHDTKKQVEATGCCCNLSLGDERGALAVAKHVAPYLAVGIDSLSPELAVISIWSVGNLAASSARAGTLLAAQGALAKLLAVLGSAPDEEVLDAAGYAVGHFVYQLKSDLKVEHLQKLLQILSSRDLLSAFSRVLFTLSCHPDFTALPEVNQDLLLKLLETTKVSMESYSSNENGPHTNELLYLVRTLSNLCIECNVCDIVLEYFVRNNFGLAFKNILNLNNVVMNKSVMWLLGNLLKYSTDNSSKNKYFAEFCNNTF